MSFKVIYEGKKTIKVDHPQDVSLWWEYSIYPALNTLDEVIELAQSALPKEYHNTITSLLYTYHNTLLTHLNKDTTTNE